MCHLILFLPVFALPVFWFLPFATALSVYLVVSGVSLLIYLLVFKAMRLRPMVGKEAMLGKTGVVIKDIAPEGKIEYACEIWNARVPSGKKFSVGDTVVITGFRGLDVIVKEASGREATVSGCAKMHQKPPA